MTPTANNQAVEAADLPETVAQALKKAFSLGQTYWQQAEHVRSTPLQQPSATGGKP